MLFGGIFDESTQGRNELVQVGAVSLIDDLPDGAAVRSRTPSRSPAAATGRQRWRRCATVMPLHHLNEAMLDVLVRGEGPTAVLVPTALLLGFATVMTAVAAKVFRWDRA